VLTFAFAEMKTVNTLLALLIGPLTGLLDACPKYDRDGYPNWIDVDHDCQNTRAEVLIRDNTGQIKFRNGDTCLVDSGQWLDPYTGNTLLAASDIQIDHFVPLSEAHKSGAWAWSPEKKKEFANYLGTQSHLLPVTGSINGSKGDRDPSKWLPPDSTYWNTYLKNWAAEKIAWDLKADKTERDFLKSHLPSYTPLPAEAPEDICTDIPTLVLSPPSLKPLEWFWYSIDGRKISPKFFKSYPLKGIL
jgi:hypothetical protein